MRSVVQGHCRQRFANIFTCCHEQDEALEIIGGLEPGRAPEQALEFLAARADIAVVTLGERGCILRSAETDGVLSEPAASGVTVADATGGRPQKLFPSDFSRVWRGTSQRTTCCWSGGVGVVDATGGRQCSFWPNACFKRVDGGCGTVCYWNQQRRAKR